MSKLDVANRVLDEVVELRKLHRHSAQTGIHKEVTRDEQTPSFPPRRNRGRLQRESSRRSGPPPSRGGPVRA
jgi:hypothetical protein